MRFPAEDEGNDSPPPGWVSFYPHMFNNGVMLPLLLFAQSLLSIARVAPAQLTPNAWRMMLALDIIWPEFSDKQQMTIGLLTALTILKTIPSFLGFYSLNSRYREIFKSPSSNKH